MIGAAFCLECLQASGELKRVAFGFEVAIVVCVIMKVGRRK